MMEIGQFLTFLHQISKTSRNIFFGRLGDAEIKSEYERLEAKMLSENNLLYALLCRTLIPNSTAPPPNTALIQELFSARQDIDGSLHLLNGIERSYLSAMSDTLFPHERYLISMQLAHMFKLAGQHEKSLEYSVQAMTFFQPKQDNSNDTAGSVAAQMFIDSHFIVFP